MNNPNFERESGSTVVAVLMGFVVLGTMVYLNSEYLKGDLDVEKKVKERQQLLGLFRTLDDGLDCAATLDGISTLNCTDINAMNAGLGPVPKTSKKKDLATLGTQGLVIGGKIFKLECSSGMAGSGRHGLRVKIFDGEQGFAEKQGSKVHCSFVPNSYLSAGGGTSAVGGSSGSTTCSGVNEVYSPELATCIPVVTPDTYDQLFISSQEINVAQQQYQAALKGGQSEGGSQGSSSSSPNSKLPTPVLDESTSSP